METRQIEPDDGWQRHGKLLIKVEPSGRIVVKCPRCTLNIKIDKREIESKITQ